jgi:hypothetical protein
LKEDAMYSPMGAGKEKSITLKAIKGILHVNLTTIEEAHCYY